MLAERRVGFLSLSSCVATGGYVSQECPLGLLWLGKGSAEKEDGCKQIVEQVKSDHATTGSK